MRLAILAVGETFKRGKDIYNARASRIHEWKGFLDAETEAVALEDSDGFIEGGEACYSPDDTFIVVQDDGSREIRITNLSDGSSTLVATGIIGHIEWKP
jgi:hypothetical protein